MMKKNQIKLKTAASRMLTLFLAVCLLTAASVPAFAAGDEGSDGFTLRIVHTNDIHARVEDDGSIDVPRLANIIKGYTQDADLELVLDSGDMFHGKPIATVVQGESIAKLARACGYDAMTAGNHDWSYGAPRLKELCEMADMAMLTGNVVVEQTGEPFFDQQFYTESVEVNGGELKVGVFGVIDPVLYQATAPVNVAGLSFTDPAAYANEAADALREQGCDIVIGLAHTIAPAELAAGVNGVDLWLAGHEHMELDQTVTTPNDSETRVIESNYYLYSLSLIEITGTLDDKGQADDLEIHIETVDHEAALAYEPDEALTALMEQINAEQQDKLLEAVGKTPEPLPGVWEDLRIAQQKLGNVVTDAYLLETGADVAFENAGGIRGSIANEDVTYGDIIGVSPYGNYIVTKELTGAQLMEVLEISTGIQVENIAANEIGEYDAWPSNSGSYLQFGGMTVTVDIAGGEGGRVRRILVGGEPLDTEKLYTVAVNNYLAGSSDYPQLAEANELGQFTACDEALVRFFRQDSEVIAASTSDVRQLKADGGPVEIPFVDVEEDAWYRQAVEYVYGSGLMTGISNDIFAPEQVAGRAQFVTTLWRMEGMPRVGTTGTFTDVRDGDWFEDAVNWAAENGIASGIGAEKFAPNEQLTREQMCLFLMRYAKLRGMDVSAVDQDILDGYSDEASISGYAREAVRWAVSVGLLKGMEDRLEPQSVLSRAEMAAVLERLDAYISK